jgi:hypothetical protein
MHPVQWYNNIIPLITQIDVPVRAGCTMTDNVWSLDDQYSHLLLKLYRAVWLDILSYASCQWVAKRAWYSLLHLYTHIWPSWSKTLLDACLTWPSQVASVEYHHVRDVLSAHVISRTPDPISHPYCHHPFHCVCYTTVGSALLPPSIIHLNIQPSGHCSQPVPLTPKSSDLWTSRTCPDISWLFFRASQPDFRTYIRSSPMSRSISDMIQ